jgi:hypothetical protein
MSKINPKLLDKLAEEEVQALLDGIQDEELRQNPAFLAKVRQFLKDNDLKTTPETTAPLVKQITKELPDFGEDDDLTVNTMDTRTN